MRALDTNVIVRVLTGDDAPQAATAWRVIGQQAVFVPRTVPLEVEWVLRGVYGLPPARIIPALRAFAGLPGVTIEDAAMAATAMDFSEAGMDFADALHRAASGACESVVTFDRWFARSAAGSRAFGWRCCDDRVHDRFDQRVTSTVTVVGASFG